MYGQVQLPRQANHSNDVHRLFCQKVFKIPLKTVVDTAHPIHPKKVFRRPPLPPPIHPLSRLVHSGEDDHGDDDGVVGIKSVVASVATARFVEGRDEKVEIRQT